jgi:uncharacterized membrane protein YcaP (DUF421 family)
MATALSLAIVAGCTTVIYLFLIVLLRLFGRRELGQLSVVDLIVVLILGSAVETAMIHGNLTLPAGLTSAATLLVVNKLLTWLFLRFKRLRHLVGGGPILLVHNGKLVDEHCHRVGMSSADVAEAVRSRGYDDMTKIKFAILETDGEVTVVAKGAGDGTGGTGGTATLE